MNAIAQSDAEALLAIEGALCRYPISSPESLIALRDVALFEVTDPAAESVPLNAAWDLGTLDVSDRGIRFESDVRRIDVPAKDIQDVRVAGMVAVVAIGPEGRTLAHLGLGGYPAYASLIALSIRLATAQTVTATTSSWLAALRDSVLDEVI